MLSPGSGDVLCTRKPDEDAIVEITAKPRHRGWLRAARVAGGVVALLAVVLLAPLALGLQMRVVADDAMAGTHGRGSLVFGDPVPANGLAVGDVVTFQAPGTARADGPVTRRIVALDPLSFRTRGDAAPAVDAWRVPYVDGAAERVVFSLPFAGRPLLALDRWAIPPWTPAAVMLGTALGLVLVRRGSRAASEQFDLGVPEALLGPTRAGTTPHPG